MRTGRILGMAGGNYHVMSRILEGRYIFGEYEKGVFRKMMLNASKYCGVKILTYSIMSNHFHILLTVPERKEISDEELLKRLSYIKSKKVVKSISGDLERLKAEGREKELMQFRARYTYRMYDLSEYMKMLKQNFSSWYNRNHNRKGPLWEDRFKSVLVENNRNALLILSSYIDLNAVRAGIIRDPKDYRYCGYAEAVAGNKEFREGLSFVMDGSWSVIKEEYRQYIYETGHKKEKGDGFRDEDVLEVIKKGGRLSIYEVLRCRVRYFSDGLVFGSKEFVNGIFKRNRALFVEGRKAGAKKMKYAHWGGLHTLRSPRINVISV